MTNYYQLTLTKEELRLLCEAWVTLGIARVNGTTAALKRMRHGMQLAEERNEDSETLSRKIYLLIEASGIRSRPELDTEGV